MTAHPDPETLLGSPAQALRLKRPGKGWSVAALSLAAAAIAGGAVSLAALSGAVAEARLLLLAALVLTGLRMGSGLLPGFGLHPETRLRRGAVAWVSAAATVLAAALILTAPRAEELIRFLLIFALMGVAQLAADRIVRNLLARLDRWGQPVCLAGAPAAVEALRDWLRAHPEMGLRPQSDPTLPTLLWADRQLPGPDQLAMLSRNHAKIILVHDLPKLKLSGVHPGWTDGQIGMRIAPPRPGRAAGVLKRGVDLMLALPLAVIALPIVGLATIGIKLADPGPAFYVQTRQGRNGQAFGLLKLRTMYLDADRLLADLIERDPVARGEWETHYKLRHDPRILPVIGTLLRRSSLDELPQLANILRGDMSLVGPRPFPAYHLAAMPAAFCARRVSVMPGLTGLCQISERGSADLEGQQQLDEFYISGRGFWTDMSIFLRTFGAVFGRGGAF
jgi:lipopolysaccharide/colanic/teichoic acid biosynthesis glycosyltransferase